MATYVFLYQCPNCGAVYQGPYTITLSHSALCDLLRNYEKTGKLPDNYDPTYHIFVNYLEQH